ncbi:MAG: AMP-binding protein [Bacteroidaceae bacterium]|nr:AMP-binding protein [Candidatus Equimonas faecalis]MCQ2205653.1 AMP-binding protein [Bacteroidaceae bacterium]
MEYEDFILLLEQSIKDNWNSPALTDYNGPTLQYKDVARKIEKLHILFENAGIEPGDRIALYGRNTSQWAVAFLATMTFGAVAVPILHEFKGEQAHNIVNHSEARLLFVGDQAKASIDPDQMPHLEGILNNPDYSLMMSRSSRLTEARENLNALYGQRYPKFFNPEHVTYHRQPDGEALALINYTSGTTGSSKGVMLPYRAIWSNARLGQDLLPSIFSPGHRVVAMLPAAHMYGLMFEFLCEFLHGMHVYYLTRIPSPRVIFKAFGEVKPHMVIAVPLIIEKIIRQNILPRLEGIGMKWLLKTPIVQDRILYRIRQKLVEAFGGNIYEVIIGGAAFNSDIDHFLHKTGFPYTVGFGATETAPLATYIDWHQFRPGSCGKAAPRMEIKISSTNPQVEVGEVLVRGANVMLGYYKNPEATAAVLDAQGWYHTGDLGLMDLEGNLYIKGRSKNMLLTPNGQNVYPEEVESKMNTFPLVSECIMVQRGDKFQMLIHPDMDEAERLGMSHAAVEALMEQNRKDLNLQLNSYEQIQSIRIYDEEFQKTPKRSIKRYLYANEG